MSLIIGFPSHTFLLIQISYAELIKFIDRAGIDVASKLRGYQRKEIKSIGDFLNAVQDSLLTNTKYLYIDVSRYQSC